MTLSTVEPAGQDRRREVRDRLGLIFGATLGIAAFVGSIMVMTQGGSDFTLEAADVNGTASSRTTRAGSGGHNDASNAGDVMIDIPDLAARVEPTTAVTISSMTLPKNLALGSDDTAPAGATSTTTGPGQSQNGGGQGTSGRVPTTAPPPSGPGPASPTTASPTTASPPTTAAPTTAPPTTAPPTTAAPTTTTTAPPTTTTTARPTTTTTTAPPTTTTTAPTAPQVVSYLSCQASSSGLVLQIITNSSGQISRVRITGFATPACNGKSFRLNFLNGSGGTVMTVTGTMRSPSGSIRSAYVDVSGLGSFHVLPSTVRTIEVR